MKESERKGKPARAGFDYHHAMRPLDFSLAGAVRGCAEGAGGYYTVLMEAVSPEKSVSSELYANVIEMGDGVYGLEAASEYYFPGSRGETERPNKPRCWHRYFPTPGDGDPRHPDTALSKREERVLRDEKKRSVSC